MPTIERRLVLHPSHPLHYVLPRRPAVEVICRHFTFHYLHLDYYRSAIVIKVSKRRHPGSVKLEVGPAPGRPAGMSCKACDEPKSSISSYIVPTAARALRRAGMGKGVLYVSGRTCI